MLPVWFNRRQGKVSGSNLYTVGAMADSYFEYLLKIWLLHQKQVNPAMSPPWLPPQGTTVEFPGQGNLTTPPESSPLLPSQGHMSHINIKLGCLRSGIIRCWYYEEHRHFRHTTISKAHTVTTAQHCGTLHWQCLS
jgi:hypothetical protein